MINLRNAALPATCILIHTDGSCIWNPGPGGWACSLRRMEGGKAVKKLIKKGGEPATTNNRMELTAALEALRCLRRDETAPIIIRSDSQYLIKGMTEWTPGWASRGWRKSDGKPVENQDIWGDLLSEASTRTLIWQWVKGHAGDKYNEEVDAIARAQAQAQATLGQKAS